MNKFIKIIEVGPRDGLQNATPLSPVVRAEYARRLSLAGIKNIEIGSFVNPRLISMRDSNRVLKLAKKYDPSPNYISLVGNEHYAMKAIIANTDSLAVFTTVSETFSQHNSNCTIDSNLLKIKKITDIAKLYDIPVRGYVSCVMGCPYEGYNNDYPNLVGIVAAKLIDLGCYEVSLGDTIGIGDQQKTTIMIDTVSKYISTDQIAVHFHNTYGRAPANICAALDRGVTSIDAASGGLGGCPYVTGATGNIATEEVVRILDDMNYDHGVNISKLNSATNYIQKELTIEKTILDVEQTIATITHGEE